MPLSLGSVYFNLGADTTGLRQSMMDLRSIEREVNNLADVTDADSARISRAWQRQEKASTDALQRTLNFTNQLRRQDIDAGYIQRAQHALNDYINEMSNGVRTATQFQRSNETFNASLGRVQRDALQTATAFRQMEREIGTNVRQVGAAFQMLERDMARAARNIPRDPLASLGGTLRSLSGAVVLMAGPLSGIAVRFNALASIFTRNNIAMGLFVGGLALGAYGVTKLGDAVFNAARAMQQYQAMMQAATLSQATANENIAFGVDLANRTGLALNTVIPAWARFSASVRDTGLQGQKAREIFETFAQVGARMHIPEGEMQGILRALDQMISKGQVFREELVQQLGDRFPGVLRLSAQAMGVTTAQFNKMVQSGQVMSEDFLPKLAAQIRETFDVQLGGTVNTLQASMNRVSNAWILMLDNINKAVGVTDTVQKGFSNLSDLLVKISQNFSTVAASIAAVGTAVTILSVPTIVKLFASLAGVVRGLAFSFEGLALAMGANPFGAAVIGAGLLATAIATAIGVFDKVKDSIDQATLKEGEWIDSLGRVNGALQQSMAVRNTLIGITNNLSAAERLAANTDTAATAVYIKNTQAMATAAQARAAMLQQELRQKIDSLKADNLEGPSVGMFGQIEGVNPELAKRKAEIAELEKNLQDTQKYSVALQTSVTQMMKGPLDTGSMLTNRFKDAFGPDTQTKIKGTAKSVDNLILETRQLSEAMKLVPKSALDLGNAKIPGAAEQIINLQNLAKAREMIRGLSQEDLKGLQIQLAAAGFSGQDLDKTLASLITKHDQMEKAVNKFTSGADTRAAEAAGKRAGAAADRAGKLADKLKNAGDDYLFELTQLERRFAAMQNGPAALEQFDKEMAAEDHAQRFAKSLRSAGYSADFVASHYQEMLDVLRKTDAFEYAQRSMNMLRDAGAQAIDTMSNALVDMAMKGEFSFESLKDTVRQIAGDILKTLVQLSIANPIKNALFGLNTPTMGAGNIFSTILGGLGKIFGGGLATGGEVQPGRVYMVGEKGPEPFIPKGPGTIIPHGVLEALAGSKSNKPAQAYVQVDVNGPQTDRQIQGMITMGVAAGMRQVQETMPQQFADYDWRH